MKATGMRALSTAVGLLMGACAFAVEQMPMEIRDLPGEQIVDVTAKIYAIGSLGCARKADSESPSGLAAVYIPKEDAEKTPEGILFGVYDPESFKKSQLVVAVSNPTAADEGYHWYRIQPVEGSTDGVIGEKSQIYVGNWAVGVHLNGISGKFDYWVCIKAQGPRYVLGSTKENAVYLGKAILVKR